MPRCAVFLLCFAATVSAADLFTAEQRKYWAFQKVVRQKPLAVKAAAWVWNPIDRFILARLEAKGLSPAPAADKVTLLRRASFDLTGLPPTPEQIDEFVKDSSPRAWQNAVERLLASPHYGERWARHWLDLARYAESEGFKSDETRPNAWRYRDYVIRAFNSDKPYDRFVKEQIAGDEFWPADAEARVATAFNRHYPDESNARNLLQRRQEILNDITDTTGAVFTGLTFGCARCHDHKFDPILQADYYRLQAFFANVRADDEIVMAPPETAAEHQRKMAGWQEKTRHIQEQMLAVVEPRKKEIVQELFEKYPPEIQAAIVKPDAERTPIEWQMFYKAKPYMNPEPDEVARALRGEAKRKWDGLKKELDQYASLHPGDLPIGVGITEASPQAPRTFTLAIGVYDKPVQEVEPGFLTILDPKPAKIETPAGLPSTGRRMALASWLASAENPLTARVMVNRIWNYHFGEGIVATPSDFGAMGEAPSHRELLDWMADEFVRSGWSVKHMHRLIMNSSAYRQSSRYNAIAAKADPGNRLLWRFPRQRLEAEVIRDASLAVSGMLYAKMYGPSVFPELPPGMTTRGGWKTDEDAAERNRRSVYIFVRRNTRYPMLEVMDLPDTHESCARRNVTTTAPQALTFLNSKVVLDWAQAFAGRVLARAGSNVDTQIDAAYQLAYSRRPAPDEVVSARKFFARHKPIIEDRLAKGEKVLEPVDASGAVDKSAGAALVDFCHMLLNANEFVYRN